MTRKFIVLVITSLGWTVAGCQVLVGIDDTKVGGGPDAAGAPDAADAAGAPDAQTSFVVRGTAAGVLGPLSIRLEYPGGSEMRNIVEDGAFAFEAALRAGDSYTVTFVGEPPCTLDGATGVVMDADPAMGLTCGLAELTLSGPAVPDLGFDAAQTAYDFAVSLLQQNVRVTATTITPEVTVIIAGTTLTSGVPSEPIPLDLDENSIDVEVSYPGGDPRIYRITLRRGAGIAQYAYGKAPIIGVDDSLGTSVALSGDTLVVGTALEDSAAAGVGGNPDDNTVSDSGAVYVFRRSEGTWAQEAYIKASNTGADDRFGASVALSGDTLAVGAFREDSAATGVGGSQSDNSASDSGAVYVFRRSGTLWAQEAYIKASNTGASDRFGWTVALSGDTLAVGAIQEDSSATGVGGSQSDNAASNSGAVYVFRRSGSSWAQEAYVKASNTGVADYFGTSVALSDDTLVVGAYLEDSAATGVGGNQGDNAASDSGAAYVFRRSGSSWAPEAYIKASNTGADDRFGTSVALAGDTLAIGADGEASAATGVGGNQGDNAATNSGAVYIFRRFGSIWAQDAYVKASNTGGFDSFGLSVALAGDTLAVGAPGEDSAATVLDGNQADNSASASGAVYIFRRSGSVWAQQTYVKASNTGAFDNFGISVALSDNTLAVGASGEDSAATGVNGNQADDAATQSGAVYVFH